ncbi:MAG: V-type ATP synthase subunit E family protein [bacterium]
MNVTADGKQQDALCEGILSDARNECELALNRARQDAGALLEKAAAEAESARREKLGQAGAESDRRRELILATVPVEATRLHTSYVEGLLQAVHADILKGLAAVPRAPDYRETVLSLVLDALPGMTGDSFVVKLSTADRREFGDWLAGETVRRAGRASLKVTVADDQSIAGGGAVVEDSAGRQAWDNRLEARLERMWPELRRRIAGLIIPAAAEAAQRGHT